MSAKSALEKYLTKNMPKSSVKRKNKTPERDFVRTELLPWLKNNEFSVHVVEAKAVWSPSAGRFLNGQTVSGMSDIVGCDKYGRGAFIEAKAPGKRHNIYDSRHGHQREFLIEKIEHNAFAVCVDSIEYIENVYKKFHSIHNLVERRAFLKRQLFKS